MPTDANVYISIISGYLLILKRKFIDGIKIPEILFPSFSIGDEKNEKNEKNETKTPAHEHEESISESLNQMNFSSLQVNISFSVEEMIRYLLRKNG